MATYVNDRRAIHEGRVQAIIPSPPNPIYLKGGGVDLLGHQTPGGIAPVARGDLLAGRGGQRRIGIGQAQAPGVFQRGGAALRRDGRGAISRMLLCQALLGRQRARFQLGQNQTGGVVAIAGVAGIKAGL